MQEITYENIEVMFDGNIPAGTELCVRERGNGPSIVGKVKSCKVHSYCIVVTLYNMYYKKANDILDDLLPPRIDGTKEFSTSSHRLFVLNYKRKPLLRDLKPPKPTYDHECVVM